MISKCSLYNDSEMKDWDDYVRTHSRGTPFHLHSWIKTIYQSYNLEPHLFSIKNEEGIITSILPLFAIKTPFIGSRLVSLPFTDYCGPLCNTLDEEKELLRHVTETFGNHVKYVEIRSSLINDDFFISDDFYKRHFLELSPDSCNILKNVDKKTIQYSIRKAQKSGVEIREENSLWGIKEFYRLNKMTRKKHGIPHQPRCFFENLYKNMFSDGNAFLLLAFSDSKVIAGGLFLKLNQTIYYKYNASDQKWLTEKRPNHLLTWNAIESACREHYDFFDFGRTSPSDDGLMRYKEMWGARVLDLPYYYYPTAKGLSCGRTVGSKSTRILRKVWNKMPDPIIDFLGSMIYKHLI